MKALILAGGVGSRLRPVTYAIPKHLVPLLGKAMIEYPIGHIVEAGIKEIGIVIGYLGNQIINYLGDGSRYGAKFTYLVQRQRLGIAHAIHLAIEQGFIDQPFVVYLGDNILANGITEHLKKFIETQLDVYILLSKVKNPNRFGVAIINNNKIEKLIEKPKEKISDLAVIGVYFFRDPDLVKRAFKTLRPSERGEYEITELIQWFIKNDYSVGFDIVPGWWKDVGTPESLLEALYLLLDESQPRIEGEIIGDVIGRVIVEKGAIIEGQVFGPAYIGKNVYIGKNAIIEHYVSLEEGVKFLSGSTSRSLIMNKSIIDLGNARLIDSVIGRKCIVKIREEYQGMLKLAVSDYSMVEL